ncbi:MAG: hypothetical protein AAF621_01610 [Pseudomonadota bacterium]
MSKKFSLIISVVAVLGTCFMPHTAMADNHKNMKHGGHKKGQYAIKRFNNMDTDKNGKISKSEFMSYKEGYFAKKDKNGDGMLTQDEFSPTLAKMKKDKS